MGILSIFFTQALTQTTIQIALTSTNKKIAIINSHLSTENKNRHSLCLYLNRDCPLYQQL